MLVGTKGEAAAALGADRCLHIDAPRALKGDVMHPR